MKKLAILATAFVLAASAANAESVTINHQTAGSLKAELDAAIAASETLASYADITELTITGEAALNATDFAAIRANLRPSLVSLDMSGAKFKDNIMPGELYSQDGQLNKMTELVEVKLPETLTLISGGCFAGCSKLERVNLPEGLSQIWNYTFRNCKKINFEKFPDNVKIFRDYCFEGCTSLTTAVLPPLTREIRDYAFNQTNVTFSVLPETTELIGRFAFYKSKVSFDHLPDNGKLKVISEDSFNETKVSFHEFPDCIETIGHRAFRNTNVKFSSFPSSLTSLGTAVFCNISSENVPEFTIPNVAGLWETIPNQTFYIGDGSVTRSFICRSPKAPKASTDGIGYTGVFGQATAFPNITFKVLASALESYQNTAPYNTMTLEVLKTAVPEPVIEMPVGHDAANVSVKFVVNEVEQDGFGEVLEGEGKFVVSFGDAAHEWLHVQEISYVAPEVYAEGEDETGDAAEETDPNVLYRVGNVSESLKKTIEVPVTVTPDMKPLRVTVGLADVITGVERVNAPDAVVTRDGDIVNLTVPGATLYDLAGRMVLTTETNTLDLGAVPAGVYVLRTGKKAVKIVK